MTAKAFFTSLRIRTDVPKDLEAQEFYTAEEPNPIVAYKLRIPTRTEPFKHDFTTKLAGRCIGAEIQRMGGVTHVLLSGSQNSIDEILAEILERFPTTVFEKSPIMPFKGIVVKASADGPNAELRHGSSGAIDRAYDKDAPPPYSALRRASMSVASFFTDRTPLKESLAASASQGFGLDAKVSWVAAGTALAMNAAKGMGSSSTFNAQETLADHRIFRVEQLLAQNQVDQREKMQSDERIRSKEMDHEYRMKELDFKIKMKELQQTHEYRMAILQRMANPQKSPIRKSASY